MDWLVYVDPSPRGDWALSMAALLPRTAPLRLWLLATVEDLATDPGLLARARARLSSTAAETYETSLPGPAERAVVEGVAARPFDLVVVPPAGRNAIQRMLRGSRVATIVRSVRAPVLVARRPPERLDHVLVALSGGALTSVVARTGADLADGMGARATFLHVADEVPLPGAAAEAAEDIPRDPEESVREVLRGLERERALAVRDGLVVDELIGEFEDGGYQLLVIGAQGSTPADGWAREDLTERLLLRCPGSTLVVPPSAGGH